MVGNFGVTSGYLRGTFGVPSGYLRGTFGAPSGYLRGYPLGVTFSTSMI